jgi:hypothetical protein
VVPVGISDLPRRTFVFMEAYCADPRCDCRRVMLNVVDAETHDQVATINYGFEPPQPASTIPADVRRTAVFQSTGSTRARIRAVTSSMISSGPDPRFAACRARQSRLLI